MESESGKGTEGGTGKESDLSDDQNLLSDLRRELETLQIELGNWMEGASGKDKATVRALMRREEALRYNYASLLTDKGSKSRKARKVYADGIREEVKQMLLELKELESGKEMEKLARKMDQEKSQSESLLKEVISAERERKDLLGSLTPTVSLWKEIDSQTTWTTARNEPATATATARDDENELVEYFNLMLQDMEDLGHRMLSMLYFLNKSNDPICSYKATELCSTTAKLNMQISKGFSMNQEQEQQPELEPGQINLPSLFRKYYRFPNIYENTLVQLHMEEEETKCEDVKVKKTKEEEEKEKDPSTMEYFKKSMELDQYFFAENRT